MNVEVDFQVATVELGPAAARDPTDAELHRLRQVRRQLEREAAHFYAPNLRTGDWIYFDLEIGRGTSHGDSDLPDLDDVVLFFGSMASERSRVGTSVDLMLCGSTEHLLKKTATAGRMGSGTRWLYELIRKINDSDARGDTEIPDDLTWQALAVPRVNRPDEVARWVFDVIARHHAPRHRARVQGLARVDLNIPEEEGFRDWSWPLRSSPTGPSQVLRPTRATLSVQHWWGITAGRTADLCHRCCDGGGRLCLAARSIGGTGVRMGDPSEGPAVTQHPG